METPQPPRWESHGNGLIKYIDTTHCAKMRFKNNTLSSNEVILELFLHGTYGPGVKHGGDTDSTGVCVLCEAAGVCEEQWLLRVYQASDWPISNTGVWEVWWDFGKLHLCCFFFILKCHVTVQHCNSSISFFVSRMWDTSTAKQCLMCGVAVEWWRKCWRTDTKKSSTTRKARTM